MEWIAKFPFALSLSKGLMKGIATVDCTPPTRSMAARGQSLLPITAKVTKNACPCTPLNPPVLATGGMRQTAHESFAVATHSVCRRRIYHRPLLRSSARAEGAFEPTFDRFAMTTTRTPMRAFRIRLLPHCCEFCVSTPRVEANAGELFGSIEKLLR